MLPEWFQQVMVGGVGVYIIARDFWPRGKNGQKHSLNTLTDALISHFDDDKQANQQIRDLHREHGQTAGLLRDLHTWHDQRDEDGVPVWYGSSLKRSLERLSDAVEKLEAKLS